MIDAMARNDVLQLSLLASFLAMAVIAAGDAGKPVLVFCESLTQTMFQVRGLDHDNSRRSAVGVAIAVTAGTPRSGRADNLANSSLTLYSALIISSCSCSGGDHHREDPFKLLSARARALHYRVATANSEAALRKRSFDGKTRSAPWHRGFCASGWV